MPESKEEEEFAILLAAFQRFIESIKKGEKQWESLEELMTLRADFIINSSIGGLGLNMIEALGLLEKDSHSLGDKEQEQVKVVKAAIENLVEFAVAEEYQLSEEVMDLYLDWDDDGDEDLDEKLLAINKKYNSTYAKVENEDAFYAMLIAAGWIEIAKGTELMYMTMGDERVRPWHMQYEGFTAPKESFPDWLIPPIEHRCRCYLVPVNDGFGKIEDIKNVNNSMVSMPEMPEWFNGTFKESVAKGGRIFSDEHPYFQVDPEHVGILRGISERIKYKYLKV